MVWNICGRKPRNWCKAATVMHNFRSYVMITVYFWRIYLMIWSIILIDFYLCLIVIINGVLDLIKVRYKNESFIASLVRCYRESCTFERLTTCQRLGKDIWKKWQSQVLYICLLLWKNLKRMVSHRNGDRKNLSTMLN